MSLLPTVSVEHRRVQSTGRNGQRAAPISWRPMLTPYLEDRPIPARTYPELCTWKAVLLIWCLQLALKKCCKISHIYQPSWLCPACLPTTISISAPTQPTIAASIQQMWLTCPSSTRSSSASERHPRVSVTSQQYQTNLHTFFLLPYRL